MSSDWCSNSDSIWVPFYLLKKFVWHHTSLNFVHTRKTYFKSDMHRPLRTMNGQSKQATCHHCPLWTSDDCQRDQQFSTPLSPFGGWYYLIVSSSLALLHQLSAHLELFVEICPSFLWILQLHILSCFWSLLVNNWTKQVRQLESSVLSFFFLSSSEAGFCYFDCRELEICFVHFKRWKYQMEKGANAEGNLWTQNICYFAQHALCPRLIYFRVNDFSVFFSDCGVYPRVHVQIIAHIVWVYNPNNNSLSPECPNSPGCPLCFIFSPVLPWCESFKSGRKIRSINTA